MKTQNLRRFILSLAACGAAATASLVAMGCEREGPAERTGERIDRAVDNAGENLERAGENIQDAARGRN